MLSRYKNQKNNSYKAVCNALKAQSALEYSLLIAATAVVLIGMRHYIGRNLQGFLKQNVDNLGGERLAEGKYTPGKWYDAKDSTSAVETKAWGFSYEGRHGFSVMTGGSKKTELSKATGIVRPSQIPATPARYQTLINGEETGLINTVTGTSFDPGVRQIDENVEAQVPAWHTDSEQSNQLEEAAGSNVEAQTESIVNKYTPSPNLEDYRGEINSYSVVNQGVTP